MFTILDNKSYAEIKKRILDIFAKDPKRSCLSIAKQFNKSVSTIKRYKKEYLDFINTGKEIILSHKNVNNKNAQKYSDETIYNLGEVYQGEMKITAQEQLAKMSNIQRSQLSKIEKGAIKGVNLHTIESIFNTFNLSLFPTEVEPNQQDIKPFVK